ncbi:helix-turn-helix transcriptional regulator [Secundilactobacillus kimchicus]|uniref:helix-turn-helix transcriptional regulator n=1 Tax=Secundilactobacillus kimchicus TaxID=528209 RepID=UPI0024A84E4E|nr:helix-turn-helix transcriptional regulator [Secundilactobacillus kimchicus]
MDYSEYIHEHLPQNLIKARNKLGFSQTDVAKAIGKPLRTYQRYEYGERMPPFDVALAIAHALETTAEALVDFPPYNEVEE